MVAELPKVHCPYCDAKEEQLGLQRDGPKVHRFCEECGLAFVVKLSSRGWPQVYELRHERLRHTSRLNSIAESHLAKIRETLERLEKFECRHDVEYDLRLYLRGFE